MERIFRNDLKEFVNRLNLGYLPNGKQVPLFKRPEWIRQTLIDFGIKIFKGLKNLEDFEKKVNNLAFFQLAVIPLLQNVWKILDRRNESINERTSNQNDEQIIDLKTLRFNVIEFISKYFSDGYAKEYAKIIFHDNLYFFINNIFDDILSDEDIQMLKKILYESPVYLMDEEREINGRISEILLSSDNVYKKAFSTVLFELTRPEVNVYILKKYTKICDEKNLDTNPLLNVYFTIDLNNLQNLLRYVRDDIFTEEYINNVLSLSFCECSVEIIVRLIMLGKINLMRHVRIENKEYTLIEAIITFCSSNNVMFFLNIVNFPQHVLNQPITNERGLTLFDLFLEKTELNTNVSINEDENKYFSEIYNEVILKFINSNATLNRKIRFLENPPAVKYLNFVNYDVELFNIFQNMIERQRR